MVEPVIGSDSVIIEIGLTVSSEDLPPRHR